MAVLTLRKFMQEEWPVLLVVRDTDVGMWQCLTGEPVALIGGDIDMNCAVIVSLASVYRLDSTIGELADLQPWRRVLL